ncbi:MAG: LysM peptidoglycan-binding domain-containing protein [Bacteroidota bacterium]|nr:LysM peptidoglycan-binding domain-containing protein [Bacteroidota bacterium]MEC8757295.1 LysM peptidoglycan-binding domain-containing protein [Bacteroidota bacterium]
MKMFLRCFTYLLSFSLAVVGYSQRGQTDFHIAEEGQTLYSIARLYEADVQHIMDCNSDLINNGLRVGDTVLLDCATFASKDSLSGYHRVKQGETLYSIATMYGVQMADIIKWNSLTSSGLEVNQLLKVAEASSQVNIEWTETLLPDSVSETSYLSTEERLFSISNLVGGERSEGRDTFHIVDNLPQGFALCSPTFRRDSSLYEVLGIAAISASIDTLYEWVDLQGYCSSNRHEISRSLAETLRPLHSENPNPWIVLSWQLVVLERTLSKE